MTLWLTISYGTTLCYLLCLVALRRSWMAPWLNFCALYLLAEAIFQAAWPQLYMSKSPWVRGYMAFLALLRVTMAIEAVLAMLYPAKVGYKSLRIGFGLGLGALIWGAGILHSSPYPGFPEALRMFRMWANTATALVCAGTLLSSWAYWTPRVMLAQYGRHASFISLFVLFKLLPLAVRPGSMGEWKAWDSAFLAIQGVILWRWSRMLAKYRVSSVLREPVGSRSLTANYS